MNRWQDMTDMEVNEGTINVSWARVGSLETLFTENIRLLEQYCRLALRPLNRPLLRVPSEFLIHAADVEGLCQGIDEELVQSEAIS